MRWIIALLTAAAALVAAFNEVASLDRFADEKLDFPKGLAWSLPGMVTIATLAGALMWTSLRRDDLRTAGKRLNLVCGGISGVAVALDHASGAVDLWVIPAGVMGALVPGLATWLTHLLARMTATPNPQSGQQPVAPSAAPAVPAGLPLATPAGLDVPDMERGVEVEVETWRPRLVAELVDRQEDIPEDLEERDLEVEEKVRQIAAEGGGRKRVMRELEVSEYKARRLLEAAQPADDGARR